MKYLIVFTLLTNIAFAQTCYEGQNIKLVQSNMEFDIAQKENLESIIEGLNGQARWSKIAAPVSSAMVAIAGCYAALPGIAAAGFVTLIGFAIGEPIYDYALINQKDFLAGQLKKDAQAFVDKIYNPASLISCQKISAKDYLDLTQHQIETVYQEANLSLTLFDRFTFATKQKNILQAIITLLDFKIKLQRQIISESPSPIYGE